VLRVNGAEIPESQLVRRPELYQILFTPGPGQVIEQLPAGQNCVDAVVWRQDQGRSESRDFAWCFRAA
jgi:hypothetical protein